MTSTRMLLQSTDRLLDESLGVRDGADIRVAPAPSPRDRGRRPAYGYFRVAAADLRPDPHQPRRRFDQGSLQAFAESLQREGQLQPIRVRWCDSHSGWVITAGERRWRAARLAGLKELDCYVESESGGEAAVLRRQLVENLQREQLSPIEEANAFARLMREEKLNGKQLAKKLAIPETRVSRATALLRLPEAIQARVDAGEISRRCGYELSRVGDRGLQARLAQAACENRVTHRDVARHATTNRRPKRLKRRLTFGHENGWRVELTSPAGESYHQVEEALVAALEEVRLRIKNRIRMKEPS